MMSQIGEAMEGRSWQDLLTNLPAILSATGVSIFCVVQVSLSLFYSRFNVSGDLIESSFAESLARQASPANLILLFVLVALMLMGTRTVANSRRRGDEIRQAIEELDAISAHRLALSVALESADRAEIRRQLVEMSARRRSLVESLAATNASSEKARRRARTCVVIALALFAGWTVAIVSISLNSRPDQRGSTWYDLLQVDVTRVSIVDATPDSKGRGIVGMDDGHWLYLGTHGSNYVLFNQVSRRVAIFPQAVIGLVSR